MTVTNRRIPRLTRSQIPAPQHFNQVVAENGGNLGNDDDNFNAYAPLPKHIPFPNVPHSSELINELLIFGFTVIASCAQFLHLYRTVWWLPNSYNHQAVNFYLIDTDLAIFIYVMASRRLLYCCILWLIDLNCPTKYVEITKKVAKYVFLTCIMVTFAYCGFNIFKKNSYLYLFCLAYPFILYLTIFGINVEPFLRTIDDAEVNYINGMPLHSCSSSAITVRTEIETLKTDFNNRFKQIIFTSVLNAYYSGFVPCVLVPKDLYWDTYWATQHLGFVFVGGFTMCVAFCFPVKYCDIFHRAALHLGQWNRVGHRSHHPPPLAWSKSIIWPYGTYIKYLGDVYKSAGFCTSALPANNSHHRFYTIFKNPALLYLILLYIQMFLVLVQLIILLMSREWQNLISLAFLLLTNYYTLFKIARDWLVAKKIYASENSFNDKNFFK